mmetsp:Transcript_12028/g.35472  ORF Transcript_12028/g.35472 Transcript_12028/m.35472 type:complete len:317 (+) Transcript_12028:141-1091(+)
MPGRPPHAPAFLPARSVFPLAAASAAAASAFFLASSSRFTNSGSVRRRKSTATLVPLSIGSSGSLRRRWFRHAVMMRAMSTVSTLLRPSNATSALAARLMTMSPRRPSTSRREQMSEISSSSDSLILMPFLRRARASMIFFCSASCSGRADSASASGSCSYARRSMTSCVRWSASISVSTLTDMPKRSSSCGRSSPSCGLPLPIMMNLAGCTIDTPSRSTVLRPDADESSTTSTRPSSRRLTSSTYRMPRLALASRPGSYAFTPSDRAFSMSIVPQMRSSVAPSGSSTSGVLALTAGSFSPARKRASASGPMSFGS